MRHIPKRSAHLKHIREATDFLRRLGATAIEVVQNKHLRLAWRYRGVTFAIPLALSPRGTEARPVWAIRAKLRRAGFAIAA